MLRLSTRLLVVIGSLAVLTATYAGGAGRFSVVLGKSVVLPVASAHPQTTAQQVAVLKSMLGSESTMGMPSGNVHGRYRAPLATVEQPIAPTGDCANSPDFNWLSTDGIWIVDDHGCKVRLEGVTWYGMQTINYVPAGLDYRTYVQIMQTIKGLGFNSIRIPLSDQLVHDNVKIKASNYINDEPDFQGKHPLWILDRIVAEAAKLHLFIILDNHVTYAINTAKNTGISNPVWYEGAYTEQDWINDWLVLTNRYLHRKVVTGFDLRDEPHTAGPGPWTVKTYLRQGSTWGPYNSPDWNPNTDWAAAATRCADAIQAVNPNLLFFIEGVELYPVAGQPGGVDSYWWGSVFKGVAVDPISLTVPRKVVYSPHEFGPWKHYSVQFSRRNVTYYSLRDVYISNWMFILRSSNLAIRAPIWLGEFNTCTISTEDCVDSPHAYSPNRGQGFWFHNFILFLQKNPEISWSYYPINGTNAFDQPSNNSILNKYWLKVKLPSIMDALATIQAQPAQ